MTTTWGRAPARIVVPTLVVLLALVLLIGVVTGAARHGVLDVLQTLGAALGLGDAAPGAHAVLIGIRLPRLLLAAVVGAGLGVSGAALQGLLRNPLADPALLGVSSGAALSVATAVVVFAPDLNQSGALWAWLLPGVAFAGGLLAVALVLAVGGRGRQGDTAQLILGGVAVNALAGAGLGLLLTRATEPALRSLTFWTLGSFNGATWGAVTVVAPIVAVAGVGLWRRARVLDLLQFGATEAACMGLDVRRVRYEIIGLSTLVAAASVALCGVVGFIGLVAPHLARLTLGPAHGTGIVATALIGAILLAGADCLARTLLAPTEIPVGVVTAFLGTPLFLWLLVRQPEAP